ncbi:MAG: hypothetical protein RLZZ126_1540 [Pseudomonadota bacterium]|jgi:AraC family transcriptional activator of pobA
MATPAPLLLVPFREVRHDQPDDVLHYEPVELRARLHGWTIPAHRHDGLHQFQLLLSGGVRATLDGETRLVQAPMALMVAPGVVHGFVYEPDSTGHQVTVPSAVLRSYFEHAPALLDRLQHPVLVASDTLTHQAAHGRHLFDALAAEFQDKQPGRTEALHGHAILLAVWFLRQQEATLAPGQRGAVRDALVQRYRSLLEQHVRGQEPVSFYAGRLGVTADHLSRACRAATGRGALDLLHQRLMLEARRLLAYTPAPIVEVARELGFDDPGYFSRFFSKLSGQSPSAYRAALVRGSGLLPEPP